MPIQCGYQDRRDMTRKLTLHIYFITCLEGFLFGLYSGIFALHLQYHACKKKTNGAQKNIIFYTLCLLYVLSAVSIALDTATIVTRVFNHHSIILHRLKIAQGPVFGCSDFIAQCILIYRCWIVWGRNIRVVVIPSTLSFAYLVMWMVTSISTALVVLKSGSVRSHETAWGDALVLTSLIASMTVNALVTGLIVLKISSTFSNGQGTATSAGKSFGVTGRRTLDSIVFVVIESGLTLFIIQFVRLVASINSLQLLTDAHLNIAGINQMFDGITPTIILVRMSMGTENTSQAGRLCIGSDDPGATSD